MKSLITALCVAIAAGTLCAAPAEPWPGWLGPNRDGKSADKNLLKSWPEGGPQLLWKATGMGQGFSSPTIAGNTIYVSGVKDGRLFLAALKMDGTVKWSKEVDNQTTKDYAGSRSAPTYDSGNIYLEGDHGKVGCYDAATGTEKWARNLSEFGGRIPGWGFAESVLIYGSMAIVTPGGTNCIVALDKKTGSTVWASEQYAGAHHSSPIVVTFNGVDMVVNGTQGGLFAVNAKTGAKLWSNDFAAGNTANCPTPTYAGGYVFWATGYGKGAVCLKLSSEAGKITATEAWRSREMDCHHGGYVIEKGYIYGNHSGGWSCLDLKTGEKKWGEKAVGKGSLCYADGMLYLFGENRGRAALATASSDACKVTGELSVQGNGPSWAHPVVADGRLYLRYDDNLYAFDVKAKPQSGTAPKK